MPYQNYRKNYKKNYFQKEEMGLNYEKIFLLLMFKFLVKVLVVLLRPLLLMLLIVLCLRQPLLKLST